MRPSFAVRRFAAAFAVALPIATAHAQQPAAGAPAGQPARTPRQDSIRTANRLDVDGRYAEARAMFGALMRSAPDEAAKAAMHRAIAMSYAFEGSCAETVKHEMMVVDYWKTREAAEPQNAFYQQGEMANEAARVCIDLGELREAERLYRLGRELGLREPAPRTHPASLWEFRTHHAEARLAARRGDAKRAAEHVAKARATLDADTAMAKDQRRFLPYLEGYVLLFTKQLPAAETKLRETLATRGNENDPYFHYLLGEALEQQGKRDDARAMYQLAYDKATGHNPPAAFTRPAARRKLGL
jgi:tetratricopeptide (TPR) repeat protein